MRKITLSLIAVSASYLHPDPLASQTMVQIATTSDLLPVGVYEHQVAEAWATCDFSRFVDPTGPYHVQLLGDSNNSLYGAEPKVLNPIANGIPFKSWDQFLFPLPKSGGKWRVLNSAFPGTTATMTEGLLWKCTDSNGYFLSTYKSTTPDRVWLQIGGNDSRVISDNIPFDFLPALAHYENNKILNSVSRIIYINQKNGRTVLLASYFPFQSRSFYTKPGSPGALLSLPGEMLSHVDPLMKAFDWLGDRLGFSFAQPLQNFMGFLDRTLAAQLNLSSLSVRAVFTGGGLSAIRNSILPRNPPRPGGGGIMGALFSFLVDHHRENAFQQWLRLPRGEEGLAMVLVMPNKAHAASANTYILGQRFRELYAAQTTQLVWNRNTVDFVDIAPDFLNPFVLYGGRDELYSEQFHLGPEGLHKYGHAIADRMNQLDYDLYYSDEEATKANLKAPVIQPTNPGGVPDDWWLIIFLCFVGVKCV